MTSGKITSDYIGRTVYLSNSAIVCQEWIIADVNHDGTYGTVDLFSKTTLTDDRMYFSVSSQYYNGSIVDNYLESTVYNGFVAEIKNSLNLMNVASNGEAIQRHVVAPSLTEVGIWLDNYINEGAIYPIFSPAEYMGNYKCKCITPNDISDGYVKYYWTRSRKTDNFYYVYCINHNGRTSYFSYDSSGIGECVVARIRFAKV